MAGSPTPVRTVGTRRALRPLRRGTTSRPLRRAATSGATGTRTVLLAAAVVVACVLVETLALARVLGRLVELPASGGLVVVAAVAGLVAGVVTVVLPAHHARQPLGELAARGLVTGLAATLVVGAAPALAAVLLHRTG